MAIRDGSEEAHVSVLFFFSLSSNGPANLTSSNESDPLVIEKHDVAGVQILHHVPDIPVGSYSLTPRGTGSWASIR